MQLTATLKASGLTANGLYGLSIDTKDAQGSGVNMGVSDRNADANGHISFDLLPFLLQAVANTGGPCDVRIWIRNGNTPQDAPPVKPKYELSLTAA